MLWEIVIGFDIKFKSHKFLALKPIIQTQIKQAKSFYNFNEHTHQQV